VPEVGNKRVEIMRRAVVFPAPLGPIRPKISPWLTLKLKPSRACMGPNTLTTDSASTATLKPESSDTAKAIED